MCGRARGYQKGGANSFYRYYNYAEIIDGNYVDGLVLTSGIPRQHIWTFAIGTFDSIKSSHNCPCAAGAQPCIPDF